MEKSEVKQLVKELINKDPPLKNYLEINHIYGKYMSRLTKYVIACDHRDKDSVKDRIDDILCNPYPLYGFGLSKYCISRSLITDIYYNSINIYHNSINI